MHRALLGMYTIQSLHGMLYSLDWHVGQYSPNDVLEPRHESLLSDFGSDTDSDDESDWDKFSSGEHSHENSDSLSQQQARTVEARKREISLFGVNDKRLSSPLKSARPYQV